MSVQLAGALAEDRVESEGEGQGIAFRISMSRVAENAVERRYG